MLITQYNRIITELKEKNNKNLWYDLYVIHYIRATIKISLMNDTETRINNICQETKLIYSFLGLQKHKDNL